MDPFIGLIRAFGFNWAPLGWLPCNGQTVSIQQYQALFAVIGTTYGGDGKNNFMLPNLNPTATVQYQPGLAMIGTGQGPLNKAAYALGQVTGVPNVTLANAQLPTHGHSVNAISITTVTVPTPTGTTYLSRLETPTAEFDFAYTTDTPPNAQLNAGTLGQSGTQTPAVHDNFQPYLAVNFCIAWEGVYPTFP
jgi:microcystin-dependent protein